MADERIEVEDLPSTSIPSVDHRVPAMLGGLTVYLTVAQVVEFAKDKLAGWFHAASGKAALADADEFGVSDSEASYTLKKVLFSDLRRSVALNPYVNLASAATTDLSTVVSANVQVTGTTTITSFGTATAGTFKRVIFAAALTLTNGTPIRLFSTSNIKTYAGLVMEFVSEGSGNWRETSSTPASGDWNNAVLSQSVTLTPIATSANTGRFVKEGRKVTLWVNIIPSAAGTSPGSAIRISNLPFTPDTTNVTVNALAIGSGYYFDTGSQFYTLSAKFSASATSIEFYAHGLSTEIGGALTIASGDRISIQVTYEAAI